MKLFVSRWRYWWEYLVLIVFALSATWLSDRGLDFASWFFVSSAIALFVYLEVSVRKQLLVVSNGRVVFMEGLFSRISKSSHVLSSVSVSQNAFQSVMKYGSVKFPDGHVVRGLGNVHKLNALKRRLS